MTLAPTVLPPTLDERFDVLGLAIVEYALTGADLAALDGMFPNSGDVRGNAADAATTIAEIVDADRAWLARHETLGGLASGNLASRLAKRPMRLTRSVAVDGSPATHWFATWHQDCRHQDGATETAERDPHILAAMVVLRIHLDDCEEDAGPLEVLPGTHRDGRLDRSALAARVGSIAPLLCLAVRGDIVAMRPLLIHRSQRALKPAPRRIIHLEYEPATSPH
jgi:hypothetical protein